MEGIELRFTAWYGEKAKTVELTQVTGSGGTIHIHMYIDRYYHGAFFLRRGEWVVPDFLMMDEAENADRCRNEKTTAAGWFLAGAFIRCRLPPGDYKGGKLVRRVFAFY